MITVLHDIHPDLVMDHDEDEDNEYACNCPGYQGNAFQPGPYRAIEIFRIIKGTYAINRGQFFIQCLSINCVNPGWIKFKTERSPEWIVHGIRQG